MLSSSEQKTPEHELGDGDNPEKDSDIFGPQDIVPEVIVNFEMRVNQQRKDSDPVLNLTKLKLSVHQIIKVRDSILD